MNKEFPETSLHLQTAQECVFNDERMNTSSHVQLQMFSSVVEKTNHKLTASDEEDSIERSPNMNGRLNPHKKFSELWYRNPLTTFH